MIYSIYINHYPCGIAARTSIVRFLCGLLLVVQSCIFADFTFADMKENREDKIKAAYLFHFASFIEWPKGGINATDFNLCVYGMHPVSKHLKKLNNEPVAERVLNVINNVTMNEIFKCQIIFMGSEQINKFNIMDSSYLNKNSLIVSEGKAFAENDGMLAFYMLDNKLKIMINKNATDLAGLTISSKLLRLARIVE